jgi:very-short-patch-repair endonuclease
MPDRPDKLHCIEPRLRSFAAANRKEPSHPERVLWHHLRKSQLEDFKFRRQQVIGPYIVDFLCPLVKLAIEVDGESHAGRGTYDERRDVYLRSQGFRVLCVTNDDVLTNLEGVVTAILEILRDSTATVLTNPSPTP